MAKLKGPPLCLRRVFSDPPQKPRDGAEEKGKKEKKEKLQREKKPEMRSDRPPSFAASAVSGDALNYGSLEARERMRNAGREQQTGGGGGGRRRRRG